MANIGPDNYDQLVKILMIGESGVGKSNIIQRFTRNQFSTTHLPTIAIDFRMKVVDTGTSRLKMQIWDTAGQERFDTLTSGFFKGSDGIVVVYSVTDRHSFERVNKWVNEIHTHAPETVKVMLVGNKIDLEGERVIAREEGAALAEKHDLLFEETSAKTGENVPQIFSEIGRTIEDRTRLQRTESSMSGEKLTGIQKIKSKCCKSE
jgi:Ras-related protein Rab-8A